MDKIAIISDLNLDYIWEEDKLDRIILGGSAVNAARSFRKHGIQPFIIGSVGKDDESKKMRELLQEEHFQAILSENEYPTGKCNIRFENSKRTTQSQKDNANQYDENIIPYLKEIEKDTGIFITTHFLKRALFENVKKLVDVLQKIENDIIVDIVPHRIYEYMNIQEFSELICFPIVLLICEAETILGLSGKSVSDNMDENCSHAINILATYLDVKFVDLRCGEGNISWQYLYARDSNGAYKVLHKKETGYSKIDEINRIGFGDELTAKTVNILYHRKPLTVWGYHWSKDAHQAARNEKKLLRIAVAIPGGKEETPCNFKCRFCFTECGTRFKNRRCITNNDVRMFIEEASRYVFCKEWTNYFFVSEGEPTLNPELGSIINEVSLYGGTITIFSNLYHLSEEIINTFKKVKSLFVCGKMYGIKSETNDFLTGVPGSFNQMMQNIKLLKDNGLAAEGRLGVQCVITTYNYDEVFEIFVWCRKNEIVPHIMMYRKQGYGRLYPEYDVPAEKVRELFQRCREYDREEYGYLWDAKLPIPVHGSCEIPGINMYLTNDGDLRLCACDEETLGHYPQVSVQDALQSERYINAAEQGGCLWFRDR